MAPDEHMNDENKGIFDDGFDMEAYINDRLLEIEDTQQRGRLRNTMDILFTPFYRHVEKQYAHLAQSLQEQINSQPEKVEIITGVCPKDKLIAYEGTMTPMCEEDLEERRICVSDMVTSLDEGRRFFLYTVFCETDYLTIQSLLAKKRSFKGVIYTTEGEFEATFEVTGCTKYQKCIQELYKVSVRNMLPWKTVCAPYIYKFLDVFITSAQLPSGEEVREVRIDFEEYDASIHCDYLPIWNVKRKELSSNSYPSFGVDQVNYEHVIYKEQLSKNARYLVMNEDVNFWDVRRSSGDLVIMCKKQEAVKWELGELGSEMICHYSGAYRCLSNAERQSGLDRVIHTKAEIERFVRSLGMEEYVKLEKMQLLSRRKKLEQKAYRMEEFLEDELLVGEKQKQLIFEFSAVYDKDYLNYDIVSYITTRLQWELREYDCVGILV